MPSLTHASSDLPTLVGAFVRRARFAVELRAEVRQLVLRVSAYYPDCWFVNGHRSDEAIEDVTNRVFTVASRRLMTRFPYRTDQEAARIPFQAYVQDSLNAEEIRRYLAFTRLSIVREQMRDDYAENMARDPALRGEARRYRELGRVLPLIAVTVPPLRQDRWRFKLAIRVHILPSEAQMRDAMRATTDRSTAGLAEAALRIGGQPTRGELARWISEQLDPPRAQVEAWTLSEDDQEVLREAVVEACARLNAEDRALLTLVARGVKYKEIILRYPAFRSEARVSLAVKACTEIFVQHVAGRLGWRLTGRSLPGAVATAVYELLNEMGTDFENEA